ncbi:hypothetical protein HK102_011151 [Quaeritorhiza haematococci]|nr:hypothetical protein HK102_011151 [Quaeritorhiza haematococci]
MTTDKSRSLIWLILSIDNPRHEILADVARVGRRILQGGPTQQIQASDLAKVMPVFIKGWGAVGAGGDSCRPRVLEGR